MLRLSVSTCIAVDEPSADGGFITWFDILIHRDPPTDDDGRPGGDDLERGDEKVEPIGRARIAIVHVGAVVDRGESLYDALDADSGDLEALYHLYFDEESGWFRDEFAGSAGVDLGYVRELSIEPTWQGRNIELAVVQRLNTTIAAGCKVLVISVSSTEEIARWEPMGFEVSAPEGGEPCHVHLNNEVTHPRVVPVEHPRGLPEPHEEDRFKVLRDEDDEDDEPVGTSAVSPPPTPLASPTRTHGEVVRRAIASRRPSRRRH
jgi:hypothetical protein